MKIIAAHQAPMEQVDAFIATIENMEIERLLADGYVVEIDGQIKGCFVLSMMEDSVYWLKQLYITKEATANLPVLLETILVMSKGKHAKMLYVHSHQPVVDLLLDALQFHPQKEAVFSVKSGQMNGNWWAYHVS